MAENKSSKFGLGMLIGVMVGAVAGVLFAPQEGEKTRKELEKLVKEKDIDSKVKEIFGTVSKKSREMYKEARKELIEKMIEFKGGWKKIDKKAYQKIVEEVIQGFKEDPKKGVKSLAKLKKKLLSDWKKIQKAQEEEKKEVKKRTVSSKE